MSALDPSLELIWAKTDREGNQDYEFHPLICHMIDVAVVARAIWHHVLTPALRQRIGRGLGLDQDEAEVWVSYLAALHDIGKTSTAFQAKYPPLSERLAEAGLRVSHANDDEGHGIVSMLVMKELLVKRHGMQPPDAIALATAVGGHHGVFPAAIQFQNPKRQSWLGNERWEAARIAHVEQLERLLGVPQHGPTATDHPTCMVLAGLVSVADWIGSDSNEFFRFIDASTLRSEGDLRAYMIGAEANAERALSKLGWRDWTAPVDTMPFRTLFDFEPRPVQETVVGLPGILDGPGAVIIELPMGEGKTEAAFYLADRWAQHTQQRGLYVAMPTMATSNGMFGRLIGYLDHRFPDGKVNVQLIHSHAAISPELEALQSGELRLPVGPTGIEGYDGSHVATAEVVVSEWFSRRKRGLLAPYGVGTVDQTLLAALQVPHVFVRTFGLAGKTIIFDEVHAYDTYMSTLFDRLLEWLGALGSSVVILTATLPIARRDALLRAYARGAGLPTSESMPAAKYPRLSWAGQAGPGAIWVDPASLSDLSKRELQLRWIDTRLPENDGDPFPLGELLGTALQGGGCAAVICNTVNRAQRMYQHLSQSLEGVDVELLHARFPFEDRDQREKQALVRYGKPGGKVVTEDGTRDVDRPARSVLVATQIIEQSLDLDFDLMVTDLAPADLVLQRSGRLQRHQRKRPQGFRDGAILWIGSPETLDGNVPHFDSGSEAIYDQHVLLRSWLALKDRSSIAFPTEIEAVIEEVYAPTLDCPTDDPGVRERWDATLENRNAEKREEARQAEDKCVPDPHNDIMLWEMMRDRTVEDAPEIHRDHQALTRLTLPTVPIVVLWETSLGPACDPLGNEVIQVSRPPTPPDAKRLLMRSVSVSHRGAFRDLIATEPPPAWKKSSLLRHHRLVLLDGVNRCHTKHYVLELDPLCGLIIERKKGE